MRRAVNGNVPGEKSVFGFPVKAAVIGGNTQVILGKNHAAVYVGGALIALNFNGIAVKMYSGRLVGKADIALGVNFQLIQVNLSSIAVNNAVT